MDDTSEANAPALAPIGRVGTVKVADFCYIAKIPSQVNSDVCAVICGLDTAKDLRDLMQRIDAHVAQLMQVRSRLMRLREWGGETPENVVSDLERAYYAFMSYRALAKRCLTGDEGMKD